LTDYEFKQKLNKLVRDNYRYRNLNTANRKIVLDLLKKYRPYLQKGIGISFSARQREIYKLHQNRIKLDLTKEDLKDVREILGMLKK